MSTPEQARLDHLAAQGHPESGAGPSAQAHQDRESRMAADIAAMQAGPVAHAAGLTDHHEGRPTVAEQQATHGQPAPRLPDTGGHQSASDKIG